MWEDDIVNEVRKAGEELAKQANYDLPAFFKNLRDLDKKEKIKVVSSQKKRITQNTRTNIKN